MYNHSFNSDLPFLREKIQELKNALFFSQNSSLLRMATTIVSILKVDDLGQIWFFVPRPTQALQEFDREFPVKLEFFRKGKGFFFISPGRPTSSMILKRLTACYSMTSGSRCLPIWC